MASDESPPPGTGKPSLTALQTIRACGLPRPNYSMSLGIHRSDGAGHGVGRVERYLFIGTFSSGVMGGHMEAIPGSASSLKL